MIDIAHGKVRIRKWPRPRGKITDPEQIERMNRFGAAQRAWKYIAPEFALFVTDMTQRSPLLPRDILTMILYNRAYWDCWPTAKVLYPMPYIEDVSLALDAITAVPGKTLVRGLERWEAGDGGGGGSGWELIADVDLSLWAGQPWVQFDNLAEYSELVFQIDPLEKSGTGTVYLNVSTNNGASFLSGSGSYRGLNNNGNNPASAGALFNSAIATNPVYGAVRVTANQAGMKPIFEPISPSNEPCTLIAGLGPITNARLFLNNSRTVVSGRAYVSGRK